MRDSQGEIGGGGDVAPVSTGLLAGIGVYSATFATLISNAVSPIASAATSMLAAAAPALFVALLTAAVQREGARRRSVAHYAIEEALEVTLEECSKAGPDLTLAQVADPAIMTSRLFHESFIPPMPFDHAWATLIALDDPLAEAARTYSDSRDKLLRELRTAREAVAKLVEAEYSAAGGSSPPSSFQVFNGDALAVVLLYDGIMRSGEVHSVLGEPSQLRSLTGSADRELKWGQVLVAQGPAADAEVLLKAIESCRRSPVLKQHVDALDARNVSVRAGLRKLVREMEAIRRYRVLRNNNMWRRRKLKDR